MRILLTNDDGIFAEGMQVLLEWAQTLGEVTVVAPKVEQSGKSHGIEIHKPFEVKRVELPGAVAAYSVDSTPADCVRLAILGMKEQFDLVISGVNRGLNIGCDIMYSGTVGAAFEAAALGVKAMSVSTGFTTFEAARANLPRAWAYISRNGLMEKCSILNVNIPECVTGEIRITHQGGPYYSDTFAPVGDDLYQAQGVCVYRDTQDDSLDTNAVMHGHISISPLTIDRTDWKMYEKLVAEAE